MSRKIYNRLSFIAVSWLDESTLHQYFTVWISAARAAYPIILHRGREKRDHQPPTEKYPGSPKRKKSPIRNASSDRYRRRSIRGIIPRQRSSSLGFRANATIRSKEKVGPTERCSAPRRQPRSG
jgi:hypothetical protein